MVELEVKIEMIVESILNLEMGEVCVMCPVCSYCVLECYRCPWGYAPCARFAREYEELPYRLIGRAVHRVTLYPEGADTRDYYLWFLDRRAKIRFLLACLYYYSMGGT